MRGRVMVEKRKTWTGLESGLDWTMDWTELEEVWVQLLLPIETEKQ